MQTAPDDAGARLAWPADAPAIVAVQLRAWTAAGLTPDMDEAELAQRWEATLTRSPEARFRVLVGLAGPDVRAVAVVHPGTDPDADTVADGEIGELLVDPDARRRGHGSRLLTAAVDTLEADGFTLARWWVTADDDAVRAFALSAGWAPDGAHRTLAAPDGRTVRQVRLHTALISRRRGPTPARP